MLAQQKNKILVGRKEWFCFPSLRIPAIKARIDTGAKTSSIHAFNICEYEKGNTPWVSFEIHPLQKDNKTLIRCQSVVQARRNIKSSNGEKEKRVIIRVPLELGENCWVIDVSLANRDPMGYRMLLGREAMVKRIIVDPEESYCQGEHELDDLERMYGLSSESRDS